MIPSIILQQDIVITLMISVLLYRRILWHHSLPIQDLKYISYQSSLLFSSCTGGETAELPFLLYLLYKRFLCDSDICLPCQAYSDSDPEKKKSLIARYKAEGGIKNLAWVVTYQEESKDQEITDHEVKKGYMSASEILTLNGFVANQFDGKTQEAVVKGLLQDCYQSFGIDPKAPGFDLERPHPKLPELNKFWYMKKLLSSTL